MFYGSIYILYGFMFIIAYILITKEVYNHNTGLSYDIGSVFTIYFSLIPVFFVSGQLFPVFVTIK